MVNPKEVERVYTKLQDFSEKELRNIIINFFYNRDLTPHLTHYAGEHGADIIMEIKGDADPLGRVQFCFFQVKKGKITLQDWHKDICGQLTELYCRPTNIPNTNETFSRRVVLITSGELSQDVNIAIINWNNKLPIPIEVFDGLAFAKLLLSDGITADKIGDMTKPMPSISGK